MIKVRSLTASVLFLLSLPIFLPGCKLLTPSDDIRTADDLIAAHVKAIGGMEKLKALKTRTSFGVYEELGVRQSHRFDEKRPNLIRITTHYDRETGTFGYCEGFDGAAWEYSAKVPKRVTGMPATALKNASDFDPPFIDYQHKGHDVELFGRTNFLDRDVYRLRVGQSDYFFDAESFLVVMTRAVAPFHGEGKNEEIIYINSDFKPVAGVVTAHKVVQQAYPSGEIKSTLVWREIQGNVEIPDEWFSPPLSPAQECYQDFRLTALEGKLTGLTAAYQTYRELAQSQIEQAWENELNTLGYELLSHERFDRAVAVFELAIGRFPRSANLYDSLGEAYMLAGNHELSIRNYSRSLELDPDNKHAAEMIEKMRQDHEAR